LSSLFLALPCLLESKVERIEEWAGGEKSEGERKRRKEGEFFGKNGALSLRQNKARHSLLGVFREGFDQKMGYFGTVN
jgi:hypothetical protein